MAHKRVTDEDGVGDTHRVYKWTDSSKGVTESSFELDRL